ncbi:hypothetical protein SAMN05421639_103613 [Chryseobacterium shigense]|uniref:Uncharacterized protein n=1 Tax=Chryseobacterium shigense TaxID=297244 RepID=A0A1N7IG34_9FLAO|nr:hypothetical protein SAMN05421639_103613 [Chryseobacterium shigense]
MIEVNFLDANGAKILSLKTIEEVENFFENTVNCSSPRTLVLDLMSKHYKYTLNGSEFYCHLTNINLSGMTTVNYSLV